jgi:hypothetical protein
LASGATATPTRSAAAASGARIIESSSQKSES